MLQEGEVETGAWWSKMGGAAQAMAEEEEGSNTDYSPTSARKGRAPSCKKTKQVQEGGSSHPSRKKFGGPCVSCLVASKLLATASLCVQHLVCSYIKSLKLMSIKQGSIAFQWSRVLVQVLNIF